MKLVFEMSLKLIERRRWDLLFGKIPGGFTLGGEGSSLQEFSEVEGVTINNSIKKSEGQGKRSILSEESVCWFHFILLRGT